MQSVLQIFAFQAVWLACALGAAASTNWPGVIGAALFCAWHLFDASNRVGAIMVLVAAGIIGAIAESAMVASGLVSFAAQVPQLPVPPWIVALWIGFATTLPVLGAWIGPQTVGRRVWPLAAIVLGLIAGPIAYVAGERLDALTLAPGLPATSWWIAVAAIACVWAVATPLLLALSARLSGPQTQP